MFSVPSRLSRRSRSSRRRSPGASALLLFGALALCAAFSSGCSRPAPYVPTLQTPRRAVVLDFAVSEAISGPPKDVKSWWFFAYDRHRDQNFGSQAADELNKVLEEGLPYLDMYSRLHLKYYVAARRDVLEFAFEKLGEYTPAQYNRMVDRLDPIRLGRELGVDYVIKGRLDDAYLARNRTVHWTWGRAAGRIEIYDCRSGRRVMVREIDESRSLATPGRIVREAAQAMLPEFDQAFKRTQGSSRKNARGASGGKN